MESREDMEKDMTKEMTKIKDLTPETKRANILAKIVSIGQSKEIASKFGSARKVAEAVIGDDTGTILLSLWEEQISNVAESDVIQITNGYVSLVPRRRGCMHLNVGKYGSISKSDVSVDVNTDVNMSEKEYEGRDEGRRRDFGRRRF